MRMQPVIFYWKEVDVIDGDGIATRRMAMVPHLRYGNVVKRQFADGEEYVLAPVEERSMASHRQFFAAINDAFHNLPEKVAARFPSAQHLRRWALIECGHFDEKEFDCDSEKNAKRLATFIRTEDEYARISLHGLKVIVRRAKSQALPAMKKADFEVSKRDVLDLLEAMTSLPSGTLMREAGKNG